MSRLDALAYGAARPVIAVAEARQNKIYARYFGLEKDHHPLLLDLEEDGVPDLWTTERPVVIGSMGDALAKRTGGAVRPPALPLIEAIAQIAITRLEAPNVPPVPLYIKPADAAPARDTAPVILD